MTSPPYRSFGSMVRRYLTLRSGSLPPPPSLHPGANRVPNFLDFRRLRRQSIKRILLPTSSSSSSHTSDSISELEPPPPACVCRKDGWMDWSVDRVRPETMDGEGGGRGSRGKKFSSSTTPQYCEVSYLLQAVLHE